VSGRPSAERQERRLGRLSCRAEGVATRTAVRPQLCDDSKTLRILIVDDDQRFRHAARALLEAQGFDVVGEAEDGKEALAASADLHPEVVLLDVNLPDTDGLEVAERLVTTDGAPQIVLTSTRDASDFGLEFLHSRGIRGFVPKDELSAGRITELCR
jgi:two-component system, NarL family, nitrate/nitrite response regulator NarL